VNIIAHVALKPGKERPVLNGNPWIFSGSVARIGGYDFPGQLCDIVTSGGDFLAVGYVNKESKITCRVLSREQRTIDRDFLDGRIMRAVKLRSMVIPENTDAYRIINSEGDFLPGLIVDRYGRGIVIQILTQGMERLKSDILMILEDRLKPDFIVERSDTGQRFEEGLEANVGVLLGDITSPVEIVENGLRFRVDVLNGQKTGFYLDQRDSRFLVRRFSAGKRVLNLFSYTGGFSVAAASSGAVSVTSVDSSGPALEIARENMELNGYGDVPGDYVREDVFRFLNRCRDRYDIVILDPPPFARRKSAVDQAARGYKDINMRALSLLTDGGVLATFSCSHHVTPALFRQIVYSAVSDAGLSARLLIQTGHPMDHPFNISHIEGEYLKGLLLSVGM